MKAMTEEKLNTLKKVGKLNERSYDFLKKVDKFFVEKYLNSNNEMLLIHLSVAINRSLNNESVDKMPREMWQQISEKAEYGQALDAWNTLKQKAPVIFNENETQYILLHILNIIRGRN
ncbi:PRD domain-containing protein [Pediococcus acidilactici]|uniref:PRD domain-containing protein n=1 Tax=Pediococcus acidilactici TaxID=1254 RepID=UPI00132FE3F1|nr:PRD domain-containing protein [Pediococcus acidilactici]